MEIISTILIISQLFFTIVAGMYFYFSLKAQQDCKVGSKPEYKKESERLYKMRCVRLTEPLAEKVRPSELNEVIGQEKGIKALRAALCGENPQHILIYGPAGVGKTAAARLILDIAKKNKKSPFKSNAKFVEIDATTLQFDERSIADPLIGSVHDPIYQGAGAFGSMGVPQPKEGAVSKAHGGVLFIDEIGELHPIQMNKLLKVLEDRKVFFTSSYYNSENKNIPNYIKDIFENGLPADFRLIGATTRSPEEIPPALRSRCIEIYFDPLNEEQIELISENACTNLGVTFERGVLEKVAKYCTNGRSAVNLIQSAYSLGECEGRYSITNADLDEVIQMSKLSPRYSKKIKNKSMIGYVNGLAVTGEGVGLLMGIEARAKKAVKGCGTIKITGIAEEEDLKNRSGYLRRKSTARASVENALTVIKNMTQTDYRDFDIHINFPGGLAVDGPSAGIAIFTALYSAIFNIEVDREIAMTGEISIFSEVLAVGGVFEKLTAAYNAGAKKAIIPIENMNESLKTIGIKVMAIENAYELVELVFGKEALNNNIINNENNNTIIDKEIQNNRFFDLA